MIVSLKAARVNAELSQEEVSAHLRVAKATIVNWEKGRTAPRADQLKELCSLYDASMDDIYLPNKTTLSSLGDDSA